MYIRGLRAEKKDACCSLEKLSNVISKTCVYVWIYEQMAEDTGQRQKTLKYGQSRKILLC